MKITFKNIVRVISALTVGLYSIYCIFFFFANSHNPTYSDCGKIISKSQDEVVIKYGTSTELYLNIQFEKSGFKSINAKTTDYFHYKKGDTICYDLRQDVSVWYMINYMVGIGILVIGGIVLVGAFIFYIFS